MKQLSLLSSSLGMFLCAVGQHSLSAALLEVKAASRFDAVAIHIIRPNDAAGRYVRVRGGPGTDDPTRFICEGCSLQRLIVLAYDVKKDAIVGPTWLRDRNLDVQAVFAERTTTAEFRLMIQQLLTDRFELKSSWKQDRAGAWALVVAKHGPHLTRSDGAEVGAFGETSSVKRGSDGYPELPSGRFTFSAFVAGHARSRMVGASMEDLARMLENQLGERVVNKTELPGSYDFVLSWVADAASADVMSAGDGSDGPEDTDGSLSEDLFHALSKQLGLKLIRSKAIVRVFVVEHASRTPSEN